MRWDSASGKTYRPVAKIVTGWHIGDPDRLWPLYQLPEVLHSQGRVYICEGEKAADALQSLGLTATTSAHGANAAKRTDWAPLAGREVTLLPDNDMPGQKYVRDIVTLLDRLNPKPIIKSVTMPDLPESGDAADYIAARRSAGLNDVAICGELNALVEKADDIQDEEAEPDALKYQPFPVDLLSEPVRGYVTESAAAIGCDPVFIALPLLAALASAIGNSRRIELKRRWTERSILWALTIATSGGYKSPGFDAAMMPIRKRQQEAKRHHAEAMKYYEGVLEEYKQKLSKWKDNQCADPRPEEPEKPTWERCWTDDTTIEALASLLLQNPHGLLLSCDELSAWFGSFDRYSKSGTKSGGDAPRWLHIHGGRAIVIDRKTGEPRTIYVPRATMSVAGGIQPGVLRRTLSREHQESGMAARFLFAMPPKRQKRWSEVEIDETVEAAILALFDRLFRLRPDTDDNGESIPRLVKLSRNAKYDFWIPYVNELGREQVGLDDDLSATWSKLEGYAARLALVHYLIRWAANGAMADDPDTVDETSMAAGIALSRWFGQEAMRVFAMLSESDDERESRETLELVERLGGSVTVNELRRHTRKYRTSGEAETALQNFVKLGYGDWKPAPTTSRGGRPTLIFVSRIVVKTPPKAKESAGSGYSGAQEKTDHWGEV